MRNTLEALTSDDKDKAKESPGPKSPYGSPHKSPAKSPYKSPVKNTGSINKSGLSSSPSPKKASNSNPYSKRNLEKAGQFKSVLRPGIALFGNEVYSKVEACCLPRLDGCRIHNYNGKLFVFGGDRAGLCSNDLYCMTDGGSLWTKK